MLFAFRPGPVTVITTLTYVGILIGLVYVHLTVPHQPDLGKVGAASTTDLREAWRDLGTLTRHYHPYNSHNVDEVRRWLLRRVGEILDRNDVTYKTVRGAKAGGATRPRLYKEESDTPNLQVQTQTAAIFDDTVSNVTVIGRTGPSVYFEGDNIAVYIRGSEDPAGDWWTKPARSYGKGGVLVNSHYDSVSTGLGATDDGVGVVSMLQMIRHFTSPGQKQPARGIVFLFNNNEEGGLWGAKAFGNSPLLPFVTTFVNLEGAGAGGRAIMFRSTDRQVSEAYAHSPYPFGSVIANDAFKMGVIKSDTDYSVWDRTYGQRGVDIAFYTPRSLYHTREDTTRHTSTDSVAHMLSAAIVTTTKMAEDASGRFSGPRADNDGDKSQSGSGSIGVWFDMFGKGFAVFGLRGLFGCSVTLLIGTPILVGVTTYILAQRDQYYFRARDERVYYDNVDQSVPLGGRKGRFRLPVCLAVTVAVDLGLAFVVSKVNPLMVASSEFSVWAMFFSLTYFLLWALLKTADQVRPSALQRGYANIWLFNISWMLLVGATVLTAHYKLASGYLFAFLHTALFVSTLMALFDGFALPGKRAFAVDVMERRQLEGDQAPPPPVPGPARSSDASPHHSADSHASHRSHGSHGQGESESGADADENTPLTGVRASDSESSGSAYGTTTFRTTMVNASRRSFAALVKNREAHKAYGGEQEWSVALPSATWLLQFLVTAPIVMILFGQVGLFMVTSVAQTGPDGGSLLLPYLVTALMSVFVLLPLAPFIHRVSYHVPATLVVVFVATLAYNLLAFPMSSSSPYKFFFRQELDVESNTSKVNITGIEEYVRLFLKDMPSAEGQDIHCEFGITRAGLTTCSYDGASVLPDIGNHNMTITRDGTSLFVDAGDTKACTITFDEPVAHVHVQGTPQQPDPRFYESPEDGISSLQLHRRDRGTPWRVNVRLTKDAMKGDTTLRGTLTCLWDDANEAGAIPAYDEALHYMPSWAILTKATTGLVWANKKFELEE